MQSYGDAGFGYEAAPQQHWQEQQSFQPLGHQYPGSLHPIPEGCEASGVLSPQQLSFDTHGSTAFGGVPPTPSTAEGATAPASETESYGGVPQAMQQQHYVQQQFARGQDGQGRRAGGFLANLRPDGGADGGAGAASQRRGGTSKAKAGSKSASKRKSAEKAGAEPGIKRTKSGRVKKLASVTELQRCASQGSSMPPTQQQYMQHADASGFVDMLMHESPHHMAAGDTAWQPAAPQQEHQMWQQQCDAAAMGALPEQQQQQQDPHAWPAAHAYEHQHAAAPTYEAQAWQQPHGQPPPQAAHHYAAMQRAHSTPAALPARTSSSAPSEQHELASAGAPMQQAPHSDALLLRSASCPQQPPASAALAGGGAAGTATRLLTLQCVPFDLLTSHHITLLGGNPCLELTCRPERSMWSVLHHLLDKWARVLEAFRLRWGVTVIPGPDSSSGSGVFTSRDHAHAQATKVGTLLPGGADRRGEGCGTLQLWYTFLPVNEEGFLLQNASPSAAVSPPRGLPHARAAAARGGDAAALPPPSATPLVGGAGAAAPAGGDAGGGIESARRMLNFAGGASAAPSPMQASPAAPSIQQQPAVAPEPAGPPCEPLPAANGGGGMHGRCSGEGGGAADGTVGGGDPGGLDGGVDDGEDLLYGLEGLLDEFADSSLLDFPLDDDPAASAAIPTGAEAARALGCGGESLAAWMDAGPPPPLGDLTNAGGGPASPISGVVDVGSGGKDAASSRHRAARGSRGGGGSRVGGGGGSKRKGGSFTGFDLAGGSASKGKGGGGDRTWHELVTSFHGSPSKVPMDLLRD